MFFSATLKLPRNLFMYGGGELGPENDAPLLQGSHCSSFSVQVASHWVSLGHEMGQTMAFANEAPVGDTYIGWPSPGLHSAAHESR